MANPIDYHAKLLIGDLVLQLAKLMAENEALREQVPRLAIARPESPATAGRDRVGT